MQIFPPRKFVLFENVLVEDWVAAMHIMDFFVRGESHNLNLAIYTLEGASSGKKIATSNKHEISRVTILTSPAASKNILS